MKAGLIWPRGRVHMSNKRNPVFRECCFFIEYFCHTGQYSVAHWKEAKKHYLIALTVSNMLPFWKGCSRPTTLHILSRNIDFSKRGTAPLKGGSNIWKCTLRPFKGHGATLKEHPTSCPDTGTHGTTPKEDHSYPEGYVCSLTLHLLAGMGMLQPCRSHPAHPAEIVFCWRDTAAALTQGRVNTRTPLQATHALQRTRTQPHP